MLANVYYGISDHKWERVPIPKLLKDTDCVVRIHKTTICGTDLHILRGSVPTCSPGRILGHEGIGYVEAAGASVRKFKPGDKVLISCITSCGLCSTCALGEYGHCEGEEGGWVLGNTVDGCQAQYVRIPHADHSLYPVPEDADEDGFVMLSDIIPTGLEVGVRAGCLKAGQSIAIVGSGPVGLAAMIAAQAYNPKRIIVIDINQRRLDFALSNGATHVILDQGDELAVKAKLYEICGGRGADVVVEAVGLPAAWYTCENIVRSGGHIAILGVHGESATIHLERLWHINFTLTAGLVHTSTIPELIEKVQQKLINPRALVSHRFKLSEMMSGYDTFRNARDTGAIKIIFENDL